MKNYKKGFTIIEVSLVIAIAGLIFLMVFTALPQLQRQRRDTERRDDVLNLIKQIKRYQENNRGALPEWSNASSALLIDGNAPDTFSSWGNFYSNYLGSTFMDPAGNAYNLVIMECDKDSSISQGSNCTDNANYPVNTLANQNFPNGYNIYVILQATCNGNTAVKASNPRSVAALYRLEGADVYCANS